jgi:uncharacterized protein YkwD
MKIKKWLIAGRHNNYHPHLLRPLGLSLVVALLLGVNLLQNVTAAHQFQVLGVATNINSSDVISLTNQQRINNGLPALNYNSKLSQAAQAKAQDMFAKDYWAHYAPDGTSPWSFMTAAGYNYSTAGENLAKDFDTSSGVVTGWMNSPGHRANILNTSFIDTGVAVMNGTLQGSPTTLVVAFYGSLPGETASAPPPAPSHTSTTSTKTSSKPKTIVPATPAATTEPVTTPTPAPTTTSETPTALPTSTKPTINASIPNVGTTAPVTSTTKQRVIDERSVSIHQRTWSANATLLILSAVFLVSALKHTVVWRTKKRGWRHVWLRAHPAAQYGLLIVAIVANLTSGLGVVR